MLLKKLTIHNIASIADAEVDFAGGALGGASIFLISGETGAGKSTILDAICLALYDKTPRMSSIAKEDIALTADGDDKYYSNDNSQFLRRGTGEGWVRLSFTALDGNDYDACWFIQRNYKKPDRRLQKPTRSLCAADGSYGETNKRAIPEKIISLTGLDYDQFCRTVMLAQGEFTKFLKSDKTDKSVILEKLTGTGIYSELGKRIAESYLGRKEIWETVTRELKNVTLLTEKEKKERLLRMEMLGNESEAILKEKTAIEGKINWIAERRRLVRRRQEAENRTRELQQTSDSEEFRKEERLIKDFNISAEARVMLGEKEKCRRSLLRQTALLKEMENVRKELAGKTEQKESEIKKRQGELDEKLRLQPKFDLSGINEKLHLLNQRRKCLLDAVSAIGSHENDKARLSDLMEEREGKSRIATESRRDIESVKEPLAMARKELKETEDYLAKMEMATSEMVKEIRLSVNAGDICPVCGSKIERKIDDSLFTSVARPLREKRDGIVDTVTRLNSRKISAEKRLGDATKDLDRLEKRVASQQNAVRISEKEMSEKLKDCGHDEELPTEKLKQILQSELAGLDEKITATRNEQKEAERFDGELKEMQKSMQAAAQSLEALKTETAKGDLSLAELKTVCRNLETRIGELEDSVREFLETHQEMDMENLETLCRTDRRIIAVLEEKHRDVSGALIREKGALDNLAAQIAEMNDAMPGISEEEADSEDFFNALTAELSRATESLNQRLRETGQVKEQLENDDKARQTFEEKLKKEESARAEMEKWGGLYRLLGDSDGSKFRNVAQSFILSSLLENANGYMRNFTDRYTLTCNPGSLAILVRDSYRPSDPQPVGILSGGESFMASLSLALALSNLRGGGYGADILFIDEGFGTLSPAYLSNVMDTLERLHQMGGRKVGLISHVTEMKERIPVQIRVDRESPSLSKVTVADTRF